MTFSITLDWLSFTVREDEHDCTKLFRALSCAGEAEPITATYGYTVGVQYPNGIRCLRNQDRPDMGTHVIVPGSALSNVCKADGISQRELLALVLAHKGKIARLDLAIDAQDERIDGNAIFNLARSGKRTGTARTVNAISGTDGGFTLYVGSRTSDRMIRLYNKAIQGGFIGSDWWRCEVELKRDMAQSVSNMLTIPGTVWAQVFRGITQAMFDCSDDGWQRIMSVADCAVGAPKLEKRSDREKWIDLQVTPALLQHYVEHRDSPAIARLRDALALMDNQQSIDAKFA